MVAAVTPLERLLINLTGVHRTSKEGRNHYLTRIAKKANALFAKDEDAFDALPEIGQEWFNKAIKRINQGGKPDDFPSLELQAQLKMNKKAAKAKMLPGPRDRGIKVRIKEILLEDPKMPAPALFEMLQQERSDVKFFTVQAIRSEFRHSLKFLMREGLLKADLEL